MRAIALLLLLLLSLLLQPPAFTATWTGNHTAAIRWTQPPDVALTCLYKGTTLIRCWSQLESGATYTTLGGRGPLDAGAHPSPGDTFTIVFDNAQQHTRLGWALWIAAIRR